MNLSIFTSENTCKKDSRSRIQPLVIQRTEWIYDRYTQISVEMDIVNSFIHCLFSLSSSKTWGTIFSHESLGILSLSESASVIICESSKTLPFHLKILVVTDSTERPSAPVYVFKRFSSTWSMESWGGYLLQISIEWNKKDSGCGGSSTRKSELAASANWIEVVSSLSCETSFFTDRDALV